MTQALLEVDDLKMHFPVREGLLLRSHKFNRAVDGVSLRIGPGETLGLVGESGCGKSTLGRCIARLYRPTAGMIRFQGQDITGMGGRSLRPMRQNIQMIFQDPMESLNARHTVGDILEEPFVVQRMGDRAWRSKRVTELLNIVGLPARSVTRYPFEFSGGQRQRIGIARAIALNPKLVICDEPVSALDVSIQSQILNLLIRLQQKLGLTYLFVTHHLLVVKYISQRLAVMYLGKIVEIAQTKDLFARPLHPYTIALLSGIPAPDVEHKPGRIVLTGDVPSPVHPPDGCRFHTRCPFATDRCLKEEPLLESAGPGHLAACHRKGDMDRLVSDRFGLNRSGKIV